MGLISRADGLEVCDKVSASSFCRYLFIASCKFIICTLKNPFMCILIN